MMKPLLSILCFAAVLFAFLPAEADPNDITMLEVRNDRNISRTGEIAYSAIPISKNLALTDPSNLTVVDSSENVVPAQMRVLSRWGGPMTDSQRPIRWLEVAFLANVSPQSTTRYTLRHGTPLPLSNLVSGTGRSLIVDTGQARFQIDGNLSGIFSSIDVNSRRVYTHQSGAGPRLIDGSSQVSATVDANGFNIEQNGPIKAVIRSSGHFNQSTASCGSPLAYDMRMTFVRNSPNVTMEFDIRNECGDGHSVNWQGNRHVVDNVQWRIPLQLDNVTRRSIIASEQNVYMSSNGFSGTAQIEQMVGSATISGWRRAQVRRDGSILHNATAYSKPFLALGDQYFTASIQMPWMQWREPQALSSNGNTLTIEFISQTEGIGEAQARWNFAQLRFFDGNTSQSQIEDQRDHGVVELERGLLVRTPVSYFNATRVMPRLPERTSGTLLTKYIDTLLTVHSDTIPQQWIRNKNFGIQWPDIPVINYSNSSPAEYNLSSNYWSPTLNEMLEFFRTGDPKWFWDFAFPAEQTFNKTNIYNLGTREDASDASDIRTGFGVGKGETRPAGAAYRYNYSSDDYTYNQGSDEFYVLRPSGSIENIFALGAETVIERYDAARNQGGQWVSKMEITRQVSQHMNALRYGSEFTRNATLSQAFNNKLHSVMQEFSEDNFKGGIFCLDDSGNETNCETDDTFMYTGMHLDLFLGYIYNYADHTVQASGRTITNVIRKAIVGTAKKYYDSVVARNGSAINVTADWHNALRCTFSNGGTTLVSCIGINFSEPLYDHVKPMALSSMLVAHDLDSTSGLCTPAADVLLDAMNGEYSDYLNSGGGWTKGPSQVAKLVAYGVGIAEVCTAPSPPPNQAPSVNAGQDQTVTETDTVTLSGTATDPEGGTLTYQWTQERGPSVTINNENTMTATFTAPTVDEATTFVFQLRVTDPQEGVGTDTATITVQNSPDTDGDGLDDLEEQSLGTYPNDTDSDNDGWDDLFEWTSGTDPLNSSSFQSYFLNENFNNGQAPNFSDSGNNTVSWTVVSSQYKARTGNTTGYSWKNDSHYLRRLRNFFISYDVTFTDNARWSHVRLFGARIDVNRVRLGVGSSWAASTLALNRKYHVLLWVRKSGSSYQVNAYIDGAYIFNKPLTPSGTNSIFSLSSSYDPNTTVSYDNIFIGPVPNPFESTFSDSFSQGYRAWIKEAGSSWEPSRILWQITSSVMQSSIKSAGTKYSLLRVLSFHLSSNKDYRIEYDVRFLDGAIWGGFYAEGIHFDVNRSRFAARDGTVQLHTPGLTANAWHHVNAVVRQGAPPTWNLTVDGVLQVPSEPLDRALSGGVFGLISNYYRGRVQYDNVSVTEETPA